MKSLTGDVTPFISPLGTIVRHIKRCDGIILCDFVGVAQLLILSMWKTLQMAKESDRITTVNAHFYCTADDFAFMVDEFPEASSEIKELADRIHKTSGTELAMYFLFSQEKEARQIKSRAIDLITRLFICLKSVSAALGEDRPPTTH